MSPYETPPAAANPISLAEDVQDLLTEFSISSYGFLPEVAPLARLEDPYYAPWEALIHDLPLLIKQRTLRKHIDDLAILSPDRLTTDPGRQRAYVILGFLAHGYIWGGAHACEILPAPISVPLLSISSHLGLPPVATYAAFNLWNFRCTSPFDLDGIQSLHTFSGTPDESWFYAVSIAIEAHGAALIPLMLNALSAAYRGDHPTTSSALHAMTHRIDRLGLLLDRMDERCDPNVFYHRIRPFLAGSKNMAAAGLPRGVYYAEGDGRGEWRHLRGGSNGQSSLIQFFDVVLGVEHASAGGGGGTTGTGTGTGKTEMSFHEEVRGYMPRAHRRFLEHVAEVFPGGMRKALSSVGECGAVAAEEVECREAFQAATRALAAFRGKHLQMVTRYIIIPSRQPPERGDAGLATASSCSSPNGSSPNGDAKIELTGTGGTALLPFLKESRDETLRAGETG